MDDQDSFLGDSAHSLFPNQLARVEFDAFCDSRRVQNVKK
jgi:hypothetical protein